MERKKRVKVTAWVVRRDILCLPGQVAPGWAETVGLRSPCSVDGARLPQCPFRCPAGLAGRAGCFSIPSKANPALSNENLVPDLRVMKWSLSGVISKWGCRLSSAPQTHHLLNTCIQTHGMSPGRQNHCFEMNRLILLRWNKADWT